VNQLVQVPAELGVAAWHPPRLLGGLSVTGMTSPGSGAWLREGIPLRRYGHWSG
jgi:hypothetical protein